MMPVEVAGSILGQVGDQPVKFSSARWQILTAIAGHVAWCDGQ